MRLQCFRVKDHIPIFYLPHNRINNTKVCMWLRVVQVEKLIWISSFKMVLVSIRLNTLQLPNNYTYKDNVCGVGVGGPKTCTTAKILKDWQASYCQILEQFFSNYRTCSIKLTVTIRSWHPLSKYTCCPERTGDMCHSSHTCKGISCSETVWLTQYNSFFFGKWWEWYYTFISVLSFIIYTGPIKKTIVKQKRS